jgi:hypothetical protein
MHSSPIPVIRVQAAPRTRTSRDGPLLELAPAGMGLVRRVLAHRYYMAVPGGSGSRRSKRATRHRLWTRRYRLIRQRSLRPSEGAADPSRVLPSIQPCAIFRVEVTRVEKRG